MDVKDIEENEELIRARLARLNAKLQGIVVGVVTGVGIFAATNFLIIKGGDDVGRHLSLLSQFFLGYQVTFTGSLIGLAYGFVVGFVIGFSAASLYNFFVERKSRKAA